MQNFPYIDQVHCHDACLRLEIISLPKSETVEFHNIAEFGHDLAALIDVTTLHHDNII